MKIEQKKTLGIWAGIAAVFVLLVFLFKSILLPFVVSVLLAYFLNPAVNKLQKMRFSRTGATLSIVGIFILFVIGFLLVLIPILQTQVAAFTVRVPSYASGVWAKVQGVIEFTQQKVSPEQMANLKGAVSNWVLHTLSGVGDVMLNILSDGVAVFNVVSLLLIVPVVLFYVLRDWNKMTEEAGTMIPKKNESTIKNLLSEINRTLSGFIRGQASVCFILAIYYAAGLSMAGLDLGAMIGVLTGILSFVPYLGVLTGAVLSILVALAQGVTWGTWLGILIVFALGQVLEGYFLTPKLVGNRVGLHPAWIIFAVLGGGAVFGFIGVLIAVPVAAVIGVLIRHGMKYYKTTDFYKGKK